MSEELVERVAYTMSKQYRLRPNRAYDVARAIIPLVLEHAAKVADNAEADANLGYADARDAGDAARMDRCGARSGTAKRIATIIRAYIANLRNTRSSSVDAIEAGAHQEAGE